MLLKLILNFAQRLPFLASKLFRWSSLLQTELPVALEVAWQQADSVT